MKTKMKRLYDKPTMEVMVFPQVPQLLSGSDPDGIDATMDNEWNENDW